MAEDRTEAASQRRLAKAREEGRIPISRELSTLAGLAAGGATLLLLGPTTATHTALALAARIETLHDTTPGAAASAAIATLGSAVLPAIGATLAAGLAVTLLQTGLAPRLAALHLDFSRIAPRAGLRRLLGPDTMAETLRALVKLVALILLLRAALAPRLAGIALLPWRDPAAIGPALLDLLRPTLLAVLGVQAAATLADIAWVRFRHASGLRMTREELRQETKDAEGDPRLRARRNAIRLARARRRVAQAVPKATVVITNPAHYAVALAYQRGGTGAPRVVAKGVDDMAARIREIAREHRVPLVANPPLARALHRVEIDAEIPREHFQVVAEIIAYVWGLRARIRA